MANEIIPDSSPNPESALGYDGADFKTLKVDTDGHPQVDVLTSALPTGAATAENQNAQLMELQLIDDLRGALAAVGVDTLLVKGKDQLFSYKAQVLIHIAMAATAETMYLVTDPVPSGEVWVITSASVRNGTRAVPTGRIGIRLDGETYYWSMSGSTTGGSFFISFSGHMYLEEGNRVVGYIAGCTVDDSLEINVNGYKMTKES